VALVANSTAALNDITYDELNQFVSNCTKSDADLRSLVDAGRITCLPSGATSTLLDFSRVSTELESYVRGANVANEDWLVVLDGMGRSLESNWNAASYMSTGVDVLTLAMVKSEINAKRLGAEVYDCVVRLNTAP
jgi:type II pantothenate kinase